MAVASDILRRMDARIHLWEASGDGRVVFLKCYRVMTHSMLTGLDDSFHDPPWVEGLLRRFAEYYFDALYQYEAGAANTPRIWTLAHERSVSGRHAPVVRLLLGINAHINYDLVLTLDEWLRPEWEKCTRERRASRYADHCRVNTIIAASIDTVQDQILSPEMPVAGILDTLLGPLDEYLISELIAAWRETVWQSACELLNATTQRQRKQVIRLVEQRSLRIADRVMLHG